MARITFTTIIFILVLTQKVCSQDYRDKFTGIYVGGLIDEYNYCDPFNYETPDTIYITVNPDYTDILWFFYMDDRPAGGCIVDIYGFFSRQKSCSTRDCCTDGEFYIDSALQVMKMAFAVPKSYQTTQVFYSTYVYTKIAELPVSVSPLTYRSLKIYPQPAQNEIFVSDLPQGKKVLKLFDLVGREIWRKESELVEEVIDLSALQNGMYVLEVQTKNSRFTEKIVKE